MAVLSTFVLSLTLPPLHLTPTNTSQLLYSFPISPTSDSTIARLSALAKSLGPHSLSLMVDHAAQLPAVQAIHEAAGITPDIFLKVE